MKTDAQGFAKFVRALGRGPSLSRSLSRDEARTAMGMILDRRIEPVQLGAVLALWRYRKETPDELAGFTEAARARIMGGTDDGPAALDWPSFADHHKQLPWFVLAALLLAGNGVPVLMHGIDGHDGGCMATGTALAALGIAPSASLDDAREELERQNFAYILLARYLPVVDALFALRPLLGVRTAVNTFARMLNPLGARCQIQGVFHPAYRRPHVEAARLLGQPCLRVFKGGGGEVQRNPEKPCDVISLTDGETDHRRWPALLPGAGFGWRRETMDPARLAALWRGEISLEAPEAAIIGTVAIALEMLGATAGPEAAITQARDMWTARDKHRFQSRPG